MSNDDVKVTATTMAWLPTEFVGVVSKSRKEKTGKPEQEGRHQKKKIDDALEMPSGWSV
jgi:hypothetical protein